MSRYKQRRLTLFCMFHEWISECLRNYEGPLLVFRLKFTPSKMENSVIPLGLQQLDERSKDAAPTWWRLCRVHSTLWEGNREKNSSHKSCRLMKFLVVMMWGYSSLLNKGSILFIRWTIFNCCWERYCEFVGETKIGKHHKNKEHCHFQL